MFDNIGGKIKGLAKTVCWIGIGASVFIGFILVARKAVMATVVMIHLVFLVLL